MKKEPKVDPKKAKLGRAANQLRGGAATAKATGSGEIKFGLVCFAFRLYPATVAKKLSFNRLHKECGSRVGEQLVCQTEKCVVERSALARGYEYAKDKYVQFTDAELEALEGPRANRIDIVEFVPADTVDFIQIENTNYIGPGDVTAFGAYLLLSEAMAKTNLIAVGRWGARGKEQLVLIRPYLGGLVLHQVFYADEVRSFDAVARPRDEMDARPEELDLATALIKRLSKPRFRAGAFRDEYRLRVEQAVEQKLAGQNIELPPKVEPAPASVTNLREALLRSLEMIPSNDVASDGSAELSLKKTSRALEPGDEAAG